MKNELTDKEQRLLAEQILKDLYWNHCTQDISKEAIESENVYLIDAMIEFSKQYHQPDNKSVDLDGNELKVGDEMVDTTGEICGIIELKNNRLILSQGQDCLNRDKFDYLEDVIKVGYKLYIQSTPKAISDGVEFAKWINTTYFPHETKPDVWIRFSNINEKYDSFQLYQLFLNK
ncbi:MAG: hypothetical protein V4538_15675 [Bacteroidota bacterium]